MDIAIIDSGIGGMCLLPYFFKNLPFKKYVYFADIKNLPYGNKKTSELLKITIKNVKLIIKKYKPRIIVFGCNTIGISIFEEIKIIFSNQKFFAIKPNINCIEFKKEKTLILATNKTIEKIKKEIDFENQNIILCKMTSLANKVENNLQNLHKIVPYIKQKLSKYKNVKCIILGCTHYYFVKNQIQNLFKQAKIIDGITLLTNEILQYSKRSFFKFQNYNKVKIKLVLTKKTKQKSFYKNMLKTFTNKTTSKKSCF